MVKYEFIFSDIVNKIDSGIWEEGMLMPTESELGEIYCVSRITIRKALEQLEKQGRINRIQGKGTFVGRPKLKSNASFKGFKNNMEKQGFAVTSILLDSEIIKANNSIAKTLGINLDDEVYHFKRLRIASSSPISIMDTYVKKELGENMLKIEQFYESFYDTYSKIFNKEIANTVGYVRAIRGKKEDLEVLNLDENSPLLCFKSISYLDNGTPVQVDYSLFNPEIYEFTINMKNASIEMLN